MESTAGDPNRSELYSFELVPVVLNFFAVTQKMQIVTNVHKPNTNRTNRGQLPPYNRAKQRPVTMVVTLKKIHW